MRQASCLESERGGGYSALPWAELDSFQEWNLRVGYESDNNWSIVGYVENLTDEFTYDGQNNNGGILPSHFFGHRMPRTAGVRFRYSWD